MAARGSRVVSGLRALVATATVASLVLATAAASAQTCPFDDGNSTLTREGLILTRYALGMRGSALLAGTDLAGQDPNSVDITVNCPACGLDINGNGTFDATDATIISRKLAGLTGPALTDSLSLGNGTRNTFAAINSFLLAGCGNSNGTVTNIATGTGLTGGPITTTGTISIADNGVSQVKLNVPFGQPPVSGAHLATTGANGSLSWVSPPVLSCTNVDSGGVVATGGTTPCAIAACPAGYTVTGGGLSSTVFAGGLTSISSSAVYINSTSGNGWQVCYANFAAASTTVTFSVQARCCRVN